MQMFQKLTSLSEQNLIDCSWKYGNQVCMILCYTRYMLNSGSPVQIFKVVQVAQGRH